MSTARNARAIAHRYHERGWMPLPVPHRQKECRRKGWPRVRLTKDEIDKFFKPNSNVAISLGSASGDLIDIDLDCEEAIAAGDILLPPTDAVFGRPSTGRRAHRLYRVRGSTKTHKFPDKKAMLVEYRGDGAQSMFPGSIHPNGEAVEWNSEGEPAQVDADELLTAVKRTAAAALLAQHWPNGSRHHASLALAGWLIKEGWDEDDVSRFVEAVAIAAGDDEIEDRVKGVGTTADNHHNDEPVVARSHLEEVIDEAIIKKVADWLDIGARKPGRREQGKPLKVYPLADIAKRPDPTPQVEGVFIKSSFVVLFGAPKVGKSFVALDLAFCVQSGRPWHGHAVTPGNVVSVSAEGWGGWKHRVAAALQAYPTKADLRRLNQMSFLMDQPFIDQNGPDQVIKALRGAGVKPDLIVLDTLNRTMIGDENAPVDMTKYIHGVDKLRLTFDSSVVVVHHMPHEKQRPRGSTTLIAAMDAGILVKPRSPNKVDKSEIVVESYMLKEYEDFRPIPLRLERVSVGDDVASLRVVDSDAPVSDPIERQKKQHKVLTYLEQYSHADRAEGDGWITRAELAQRLGYSSTKTIDRVLKPAIADGRVEPRGRGDRAAYRWR